MATFLKYFGAFCLLTIAASLAFCSFGIYNGVQTANKLLAGADNYTCRQYLYDMQQPETDKLPAILIAAMAYGVEDITPTAPQDKTAEEQEFKGFEPSIRKMAELCKGQENERLLNVFAHTIVSPTLTGVSSTLTSPTTQQ